MRMTPLDKQTKESVVLCGCRPKVELKLSSAKKISEIAAHMRNKWTQVHFLMPRGSVLCFYHKNGTKELSKEDSNMTCFDIWKQCGKKTNGEKVVEVSYKWNLPSKSIDDANTCGHIMMPLRAPPSLFDQKVTAPAEQTLNSSDDNEILQLPPDLGLNEFISQETQEEAETLEALISDSGDEDLNKDVSLVTGRLRRRIKPVLVSKEEFNI
ncbi:hypothetical protein CCR75_006183 [Bremia lactucae]|uniref:Uncharacterized protein n=1 Tax=Bremia lactucae TaxID=4779 RepID=A0A976FQ86_BRELC|nr:hypothetical protein CCR75_004123 [Bremia lactucae]TDH70962.1 hypothetical protein CCR75_006183 [Bremia lactucae]